MNELLQQIKIEALANDVPIIQDPSLALIGDLIDEYKMAKIIEIGTAVGYSALSFLEHASVQMIDTFERNSEMAQKAHQNIAKCGKENEITIHEVDALLFDEKELNNDYDLLFIDAAKVQSQKFFLKYSPLVKKGGFIIVDNINFHGVKADDPGISKNLRSMLLKIEAFVEWIKTVEGYSVSFYEGGDGLAIARKL